MDTEIDFLEPPLPQAPHVRVSAAAAARIEDALDDPGRTPPTELVRLLRRRPVWTDR